MKNKTQDQPAGGERRIEKAPLKPVAPEPTRHGAHGRPVAGGAPESAASRETFPERTKKPGRVGLANEARPGIGTRGDEAEQSEIEAAKPAKAGSNPDSKSEGKPRATRYGYDEPRPEPREQAPDSMAHEQERSTGTSGMSGGGA